MTVYFCEKCRKSSAPEPSNGDSFGIDTSNLQGEELDASIAEWARRYEEAKARWEREWWEEHECRQGG